MIWSEKPLQCCSNVTFLSLLCLVILGYWNDLMTPSRSPIYLKYNFTQKVQTYPTKQCERAATTRSSIIQDFSGWIGTHRC
jgi:hypothetical protein